MPSQNSTIVTVDLNLYFAAFLQQTDRECKALGQQKSLLLALSVQLHLELHCVKLGGRDTS